MERRSWRRPAPLRRARSIGGDPRLFGWRVEAGESPRPSGGSVEAGVSTRLFVGRVESRDAPRLRERLYLKGRSIFRANGLAFRAGHASPSGNNCLIYSPTQLLYVGAVRCSLKDNIDRCRIARAAFCAKFGRAQKSPLSAKKWRMPILQALSANPDNYRIAASGFAQHRTSPPCGNGGKLIPLRHNRGRFEPVRAAPGPKAIDRINAKMQIAKFGARKVDFVGGGAEDRFTFACGRRGVKSPASFVHNLCTLRDMNYRPSCISGARFRLTIGNMGETTCAPRRGKQKGDSILNKPRELSDAQDRLRASTPPAAKKAIGRKSTEEATKKASGRNSTEEAVKKALGRNVTPEAMKKALGRNAAEEAT